MRPSDNAVIETYSRLRSIHGTAKACGCSMTTVQKILATHGIEFGGQTVREAQRLFCAGSSPDEIAQRMNLSKSTVTQYLGYLQKDTSALDFRHLSAYDLGIVWSIGTVMESRFVIRCVDRFYVDRIADYTGNMVYTQNHSSGKTEYVVKTRLENSSTTGWNGQRADQHRLPELVDYHDFLRAWIEIHGCMTYSQRRTRHGRYRGLCLKIFGNVDIVHQIEAILYSNAHVNPKSVQYVHNQKTAYITYTAYSEICDIIAWIDGDPHNPDIWASWTQKLRESRLPYTGGQKE